MSGNSIWVGDEHGWDGRLVTNKKPQDAGYSEYRLSSEDENTTDQMADMIGLLANAITPTDASGQDASGGTVASLTEAVMGVSAGLARIANAIEGLKGNDP